ncbi:hypothetical protein CWM58_25050 [Klebsiella sp. H-Nf2]|uniref:hypothetical protein n=1 Tax=Klebsiella sp. H-Nf2 TaxID=2054599 RepID=UPI000C292AFF|nr:hypothetical protein [Klebsiella sp. H-Nf2]PJR47987.1 hypothetical protein CWM58_25050 [Klebsiella sp. H-Nf2]
MSEPSKLLELLPSIHAGILSILSATVIAWYVYALPKISSKKEKLTSLIRDSLSEISPYNNIGGYMIKRDKNGEIHGSILFDIFNELKTMSGRLIANPNASKDELERHLSLITQIMNDIMTCKPFYGNIDYIDGAPHESKIQPPSHSEFLNGSLNINRLLRFLQSELENIKVIQDRYTQKMIDAARIEVAPFVQELEKKANENAKKKKEDGVTEEEINNFLGCEYYYIHDRKNAQMEKKAREIIDYIGIISEYYSRIKYFSENKMINLLQSADEYEIEKDKYSIPRSFNQVIYLIMYIFALGVCLPIFFLGPCSDLIPWENILVSFLTYIIFIASVFPYFLVLCMALDSIRKL